MSYKCRSCKQDVKDIHICGEAGGKPVVVQYVNRYPANRGPEFMKRFGSRSAARIAAIRQNERDKGYAIYE